MDARAWAENALRRAGHEPLPEGTTYPDTAGFTVTVGPLPGTAVLRSTVPCTGQDAYDQWNDALALGHRLLDVLESLGANSQLIDGREPDLVAIVYAPLAQD